MRQKKLKELSRKYKKRDNPAVNVSVVIPCLNEEDCIEASIQEAQSAFSSVSNFEVLVVDNGSQDRSQEIAKKAGARVVEERRRGYGSALLRGMREAQGDYIVMGDADLTYDFHDAAKLCELLDQGADFAIGDRIHGELEPGAMPWAHRKIGTPLLTSFLNLFFGTRVKDINCGLRAFRRDRLADMRLRSPGMEFASEMVIHAQKAGLKFAEMPIRYRARGGGEAKLRTVRDGWRHLRFILSCAPFPLFFVPSILGIIGSIALLYDDRFGFQVFGSFLMIASAQVLIFGLAAKIFLWVSDAFLVDKSVGNVLERFRLEHGIILALGVLGLGAYLIQGFDLSSLIRGGVLLAIGIQIFFSSFLLSIILSKPRIL